MWQWVSIRPRKNCFFWLQSPKTKIAKENCQRENTNRSQIHIERKWPGIKTYPLGQGSSFFALAFLLIFISISHKKLCRKIHWTEKVARSLVSLALVKPLPFWLLEVSSKKWPKINLFRRCTGYECCRARSGEVSQLRNDHVCSICCWTCGGLNSFYVI